MSEIISYNISVDILSVETPEVSQLQHFFFFRMEICKKIYTFTVIRILVKWLFTNLR